MSEAPAWDRAKGELRIQGSRHAALDIESLCQNLDVLVGVRVAEVIMDNHQVRLGKEDATRALKQNLNKPLREAVSHLESHDILSGMGITKVTLPDNSDEDIVVEISNPVVKRTEGSGKSFMFSYWKAALGQVLGKDLVMKNVIYDEAKDSLICHLTPKPMK